MAGETRPTTRILTVDDEDAIREMLKAGLTRAGYECLTADGAGNAALLLGQEAVDLVLLDINMPVKSGMDFLPEIKELHPDVAVIMLTGETDLSTAVQSMRQGAYDYAPKPVSLAELVIRIEHALSRRALILENREYQQQLERMVDELNAQKSQRERELAVLNKLIQSHVPQNDTTQAALIHLRETLASFIPKLQGLAYTAEASCQTEESFDVGVVEAYIS